MKLYEVYSGVACPRCGHTEARDHGPYAEDDYFPEIDDANGGPPDSHLHLMTCAGCHKPFDAGPEWLGRKRSATWPPEIRDLWAEGSTATAEGWSGDIPF